MDMMFLRIKQHNQATLKNKTISKLLSNYVFHMECLNIQNWKIMTWKLPNKNTVICSVLLFFKKSHGGWEKIWPVDHETFPVKKKKKRERDSLYAYKVSYTQAYLLAYKDYVHILTTLTNKPVPSMRCTKSCYFIYTWRY